MMMMSDERNVEDLRNFMCLLYFADATHSRLTGAWYLAGVGVDD